MATNAGIALADTPTSATNASGAYLNLNAGIATQQFTPTGAFAASLNAGYNFSRYLALEGGYTGITGTQFGATQTNNILDVAVKGTLPLNDLFALYGRLGGGANLMGWSGTSNVGTPSWYCQQNSSSNFVGLVGLGGSFNLSPHFALRLEDSLFVPMGGGNPTTGQINMVQGGVQYNF